MTDEQLWALARELVEGYPTGHNEDTRVTWAFGFLVGVLQSERDARLAPGLRARAEDDERYERVMKKARGEG